MRDEDTPEAVEPTIKTASLNDSVTTRETLGPEPIPEPEPDGAPTTEHDPAPPVVPGTFGKTYDGAYWSAWHCDDEGKLHHVGSFNNPDSADGALAAYQAAPPDAQPDEGV